MNRNELHRLARNLMDEHGLNAWTIGFAHGKNTAGTCNWMRRHITLSLPLAEARSDEETRMTVLHEIAHALTPGHKHDMVWQRKCLEIGGNGRAKYTMAIEDREKISRYVGTCPNGHKHLRQARSDKMFRISCGKCSPWFNPEYKYTWVDTQTGRALVAPGQVQRPLTVNWAQVAANQERRIPQPQRPAPPRPPVTPRTVGTSNPDDLWGTGD